MKKILLLSLFLVLLSSFVSAVPAGGLVYYNLTDLTDKWNGVIATNNGATSSSFFPVFNINGTSGPNSYDFDDTNDFLNLSDSGFPDGSNNRSVSGWFYSDGLPGAAEWDTIFGYGTWGSALDFFGVQIDQNGGVNPLKLCVPIYTLDVCSNTAIVANVWHHFVVTLNGTTVNIYLNGTLDKTGTLSSTPTTTLDGTARTGSKDGVDFFNGKIDEIKVFDRVINSAEVSHIFNYGVIENATPSAVNESTETNVVSRQIGSVSLSTSFQTIENVSFNVSVNNTPSYFSHVFEVEKVGGTDRFLECIVLLDGVNILSINRTINAGTIGNMYMVTNETNLTTGTHTEVVQCKRGSGGGGTITMSKGVCIGHLMVDENDQIINHMFEHLTLTNLTPVFTELESFNFTVSDFINGTDVISSIVVDWNSQYNYNSTGNITTFIQIDGVNCSEFQIGGNSGDSFIAGGVCGAKNLTPNQSINIKVFGKDSGGLAFMNIFVKEFLLETQEILFGEGILTGVNITFSTLTNIGTFPLTNVDKASVDLVGQVGLAVKSNSGTTTLSFQAIVNGTKNLTTSIYQRTVDENGGVVLLQDVLEDAGIGSYDINLLVACSNSDCTITGSNGVAYFSNIVTETSNAFNVSAFDNFDNSSISEFNVTLSTGAVFTTTLGSLLIFSSLQLENLTFQSSFSGGYFGETVINHNTSNDLNQTMNQTNIGWDCLEKISGADLNCTSPLESTIFNYNVAGNPNIQSLNVTGYFENIETFNVTALQSQILNSSFYSTNLTIESISSLGTPINCTYNITGITYSWADSINGSPNTTTGLINGSYTIFADCAGFAYQTQSVTIENTTQTIIFDLLTTNSFNFLFRDAQSLDLLTGINVTAELISDSQSSNYTTTNGTLYIDLLTPEFYTIRFNGEGYSERFYYFSLNDRSFNNITLYLLNETIGEKVIITIVDDNDKPLTDAYLKVLRYDITSNTYLLQEIAKSDIEGKVYIETEIGTEFYKFFVDFPFGTTVYSSPPQYIEEPLVGTVTTLIMPVILNPLYGQEFFSSLGVSGNLIFNETTNSFRWDYTDNFNTITGACLYVYEISLISNTLLNSSCTDTSSGTILIPVSVTNGSSYSAVGVILYDATEYYWGEKSYTAGGIQDEDTKKYRLSLILFLTLAIILLFAWNPSLLFIFMPIPLLMGSLTNYIEFSKEVSIGFMLGGAILAYWINKKS